MFELIRMAKAATASAATAAASDTPLSGVPNAAQAAALPIVGGTTTASASPPALRSTDASQLHFRGDALAAARVLTAAHPVAGGTTGAARGTVRGEGRATGGHYGVRARLTASPSSRTATPIDS